MCFDLVLSWVFLVLFGFWGGFGGGSFFPPY